MNVSSKAPPFRSSESWANPIHYAEDVAHWLVLARSRTEALPNSVRLTVLGLCYFALLGLLYQILRPLSVIVRILSEQMAAKVYV